MTKPSTMLTKTCSVCGLQKPLSAFLQMEDKQGASYGSVCSSCRHEQKNKIAPSKDETTTTSSSITIDSKAKVKLDEAKENHFEQVETEYHEERDKNQIIDSKETQKTEQIQKDERKHREHFLSRRALFSTDKTTNNQRASESRQFVEQAGKEAAATEKTAQQEKSTLDDKKEKDINLDNSTDTQIGKIKLTEGVAFKTFITRETNSAISRIFNKQPAQPVSGQSSSLSSTWQQPAKQNKDQSKPSEANKNESPSEFAERKWGPRSR